MSPDSDVSSAGAVEPSKTVKAGCGIRYDPDQLGKDSGFDFSAAQKLKEHLTNSGSKPDQK